MWSLICCDGEEHRQPLYALLTLGKALQELAHRKNDRNLTSEDRPLQNYWRVI
jgi:hypothetical protein